MVRGVLSRLALVRVTLSYAVILVAVDFVISKLDPAVQDRLLAEASTNLHNLSHGRVDTLISSAFVADAGPAYEWLPGLVFLLAIGELLWLSWRFLVAMVLAHVGATLLVAAWLVVALEFGWLSSDVATEVDVGMSYAAVGVLGALTSAIPRPWRLPWIGWWLGVAATVVVVDADFAYLGHLVALVLGMVVSTRFGPPQPWTAPKLVLLILGAAFGYLVLTNDGYSKPAATIAGAAGALLGGLLTYLWSMRRPAAAAAEQSALES